MHAIDSNCASWLCTALFPQFESHQLVDVAIVTHVQARESGYSYAFDDDFDAAGDGYLDVATNPYQPE